MGGNLIPVKPSEHDLEVTDAQAAEHQALQKKPSWPRRLGHVLLDIAGDAATAGLGEKAEPLRHNLKNRGRSLLGQSIDAAGEQPTPPVVVRSLRPYQTTWIRFDERVAVALRLTHLVPDVASPAGWSHIVRMPLEPAGQLLEMLAPLFGKGSGWEKPISRCQGYMTNIEHAASLLQRLTNTTGDPQGDSRDATLSKVTEQIRDAQVDMRALHDEFRRLVEAADFSAAVE